MPEAISRRQHMESLFEHLTISPVFVEAVVGKDLILPHKDFDEKNKYINIETQKLSEQILIKAFKNNLSPKVYPIIRNN